MGGCPSQDWSNIPTAVRDRCGETVNGRGRTTACAPSVGNPPPPP
jgi:hypothetical protein